MYYIVLDLEFNQDIHSLQDVVIERRKYPFEIIQIGAVKLDLNFNTKGIFNKFIKPSIYSKISPFITELTGITTEQLQIEKPFADVYKNFIDFIEDKESVFCIWGTSDIKELFKNVEYHKLDNKPLPNMYINLQPYASEYLGLSSKRLLRLQSTVEALNISLQYEFHNAVNDAYYTAEIFKTIYGPSIKPKVYDPKYVRIRPKQRKRLIDYDSLIQQFAKMYKREMTEEEQEIIKLAYKMGKTQQFLK